MGRLAMGNLCYDCRIKPAKVTFGTGIERCAECAEHFKDKIRFERMAAELTRLIVCEVCHRQYDSKYSCPDCCEHEPDAAEGFHCLNCGKDCSENVMAAAYDRAKDQRKYGDG